MGLACERSYCLEHVTLLGFVTSTLSIPDMCEAFEIESMTIAIGNILFRLEYCEENAASLSCFVSSSADF